MSVGVVKVWSRCGQGVVNVWSMCGQGVVKVWSRCGQGVVMHLASLHTTDRYIER